MRIEHISPCASFLSYSRHALSVKNVVNLSRETMSRYDALFDQESAILVRDRRPISNVELQFHFESRQARTCNRGCIQLSRSAFFLSACNRT